MGSAVSTAQLEAFYGNILDRETNDSGHSTFSQDSTVQPNNPQHHQPGSFSNVLCWNLQPEANTNSGSANRNLGVNSFNQSTQNLGVPSTSSSISTQQPFQSPVGGNRGASILNLCHQNPAENLPALANPMNSLAAVVSSAGQDHFSSSFMVEGGPNPGNSSTIQIPTKFHAATSILGKRSWILSSSIKAIEKQARYNAACRVGREPNSQKFGKLSVAKEEVGDGYLHGKITRGPSMPSQMINTNLHRTGMSNLPLSSTVTPPTINWSSAVGLTNRASSSSSSGPLPVRNDGLLRSRGLIPGNSSFQKKYEGVSTITSQHSAIERPTKSISIFDYDWNIKPLKPNSQSENRNRAQVNSERTITQRSGSLGQQQMSSFSSGQNNPSFQFGQSSKTGSHGQQQMSSSSSGKNNQIFQFGQSSKTGSSRDHRMALSSSRQNYENFPILEASQIGIFDDPQWSSFFNNEQNHQSFPTFEQSEAGTLCDFGMPSSSNDQNNPSLQAIPSLPSQTGIQSCNPQETNVLHDTREAIEDLISDTLDPPIEPESRQINPGRIKRYNPELLAAAIQEETETPQLPMDSQDQQLLLDLLNSLESAPSSLFSHSAPNDTGLNVQTFDVAATLGNLAASTNAVDTNDVANIAMTNEEEDYCIDDLIDWSQI